MATFKMRTLPVDRNEQHAAEVRAAMKQTFRWLGQAADMRRQLVELLNNGARRQIFSAIRSSYVEPPIPRRFREKKKRADKAQAPLQRFLANALAMRGQSGWNFRTRGEPRWNQGGADRAGQPSGVVQATMAMGRRFQCRWHCVDKLVEGPGVYAHAGFNI